MSCLLNYCCFCCPSAITALFCLYVQSGCNKGAVAGALTFFPPEPALYQFERRDADGNVIEDDDEEEEDDENDEHNNGEGGEGDDDDENDDAAAGGASMAHSETVENKSHPTEDTTTSSNMTARRTTPRGQKGKNLSTRTEKIEIRETRPETQRRMKSPMEQLMEAVRERHVRSRARNIRDAQDAAAGVTYTLLLDPRLQIPPHDPDCIRAVKIPMVRGGGSSSRRRLSCRGGDDTGGTRPSSNNNNNNHGNTSYVAAVGYVSGSGYNVWITLSHTHFLTHVATAR
jgi:hypothetical protein